MNQPTAAEVAHLNAVESEAIARGWKVTCRRAGKVYLQPPTTDDDDARGWIDYRRNLINANLWFISRAVAQLIPSC